MPGMKIGYYNDRMGICDIADREEDIPKDSGARFYYEDKYVPPVKTKWWDCTDRPFHGILCKMLRR